MDIQAFLNGLDKLFAKKAIDEVEPFLNESMENAKKENDKSAQFTILNEMMGFFRDTSQYDKSIKACNQCLSLMKEMNIEGTVDYATSLQNIANAHRAAGKLEQSLMFYNEAMKIYEKNIEPNDFRMASINNNIALLYQEMGDYVNAVAHLKMALCIIEQLSDSRIEVAVTHSNLGASLVQLGRIDEAVKHLNKALALFRQDEVKDFHYSAALSAMASLKAQIGEYETAAKLYEEALDEIRINMGKGTAYKITEDNLRQIYSILGVHTNLDSDKIENGIELSRKFYETYGEPMIHEKFSDYENKIAVGLVGEGSERFGFDDKYSRDHDFGAGFCMWVSTSTYDAIGKELEEEYEKIISEHEEEFMKKYGFLSENEKLYKTPTADGRCGVSKIGDFYEKYTGYKLPPKTVGEWIEIDDYKLATVTNGAVFKDNEDKFSTIRSEFANIPETVRRVKISRELAAMAQTGQSNYERAMARKDFVTANICISEFMQHTMKIVYLLNRKYAPYYKWMLKGMKELEILPEVSAVLKALADLPDQRENWEDYSYSSRDKNENDMKVAAIEIISKMIIEQLIKQNIIEEGSCTTTFLNDYSRIIMENLTLKNKENAFDREKVIDKIIDLEFEAFDKVQNVGGRAECQNNFPMFYIMRKSQYLTWTDEMLSCILELWTENREKGLNMITEKYARMMESTSPDEYAEFADKLPKKTEKTRKIVDEIAKIQVDWMEEFSKEYPKLANNARDITSDSDNLYNTSYETYLKGELLTYSEKLLKLYGQFVINLAKEGKNLAEMTIKNTALLSGYKSLDEAEKNN